VMASAEAAVTKLLRLMITRPPLLSDSCLHRY
jgi:hypothetical protein